MASVQSFKNKRVLITGAGGFIGACLTRRLLNEGAQIHAMVSPSGKTHRLHDIANRITLYQGDIANKAFVNQAVSSAAPQIIYHFATYGNHPGQEKFDRMIEVNILGLNHLLSALEFFPFEHFITSSSSAEYGPKKQPMKENQILEPNTFYGATKAAGTLLSQAFGKLKDRTMITLRLFYVYGPGEEVTRFVPTCIRACLSGAPFKLTALREKKNFIFIDDVVSAFMLAAKIRSRSANIFNVGQAKESTLGEVIATVERITGKKLNYEEGTYGTRRWDSNCWSADITCTRKILGWKPTHSLEAGLRKTTAWLESLNPGVLSQNKINRLVSK